MSAIWVLAPLAGALAGFTTFIAGQIESGMAPAAALVAIISLGIGAGWLAAVIDNRR